MLPRGRCREQSRLRTVGSAYHIRAMPLQRLFNVVRDSIAARKLTKQIAQATVPQPQAFELPRTSMFHGNAVWHQIAQRGSGNQPDYSPLRELCQLLQTEEIQTPVEFSIRKLNGVNANNHDYGDIHQFAFTNFRHDYDGGRAIRFASERDFQNNIATFKAHMGESVGVTWCEWDGRYYLRNSGRGHHTAAIYRQCKEQNRDFVFQARLSLEKINPSAIRSLKPLHLLICNRNTANKIWDWSHMFRNDRSWLPVDFPSGLGAKHDEALAIIGIPRDSMLRPAVMAWLERTPNSFFDFSELLDTYRPAAPAPDLWQSGCVQHSFTPSGSS